MISIYKIKPKFQKLLIPLLKLFKKLGISPNTITFSSILLSFLLSYFLWNAFENHLYFLFVAFGLLFRMMLNALDGMMARIYNLQSKKGEVLNEVGDIISDTAIYVQGYSGHGVAFSQIAGSIVSDAITGREQRFNQLAKIQHLPFPGGPLRTPILALGMTWFKLKDYFKI